MVLGNLLSGSIGPSLDALFLFFYFLWRLLFIGNIISTRLKSYHHDRLFDDRRRRQRGATINCTATAGCYSFAFVFGDNFIFRAALFQHCDNADNCLFFCVFWSRAPSSFILLYDDDLLLGFDVRRQNIIFVRASCPNKRRAVKKI